MEHLTFGQLKRWISFLEKLGVKDDFKVFLSSDAEGNKILRAAWG